MDIFDEVRKINLPKGEYVIAGSGILGALGIREIGDVDVLVTPRLFDDLLAQGWKYQEVEVEGRRRQKLTHGVCEAYKDFWYDGITRSVTDMIRDAVIIDGVPFLSLEELKVIKQHMGRDKDKRDIGLIEEFQKNQIFNPPKQAP